MSQRLAIAGHFRHNQMLGGVGAVFQNLSRGIEEVVAVQPRYSALQVEVFHGPAGVPYRTERFGYHEMSAALGRFAAESRIGAFRTAGFDATLFLNYFTPPVVRSGRVVTLIHDLLHAHFPQNISRRKRVWLEGCFRWTLRRADAIVTISKAVKADLVQRYGDRFADKIVPIWNPISLERLSGNESQQVTAGRPYILGVAVDRPLKNLSSLIRAFHLLRDRLPDYCLVLAGELRSRVHGSKQEATHHEKLPTTVELVRELGLSDRVLVTGRVSDAELGALYRGAEVFVLPSLFEGFGMPAIEAMSLGTPALLSDIPVFREITMNQAFYLEDPRDAALMADRINDIIRQGRAARPAADVVAKLRRDFAPANIAAQYLEVLFAAR